MLTKDHLKFHIRNERVKPVFLTSDAEVTDIISDLCKTFQGSVGSSVKDLDAAAVPSGDAVIFAGLKKLMLDECELTDDDPGIEENRWKYFAASKRLRAEAMDYLDFEKKISEGKDVGELRADLFSDLPENRRIKTVADLSNEELLNLYNVSQVKGLLWFARKVEVEIFEADTVAWRRVFQFAKFHQLILDFKKVPKTENWKISITGPLSLFENVQSYAMRISRFFPVLLHLKKWKLVAEVKVKNRVVNLKLDESFGLKPTKESRSGYIPEEFEEVLKQFNLGKSEYTLAEGQQPVNLGKSTYLFPDFTLRKKDKDIFHIELFHKWHLASVQNRLEALADQPRKDVRLGLSRQIRKDPAVKAFLAKNENLQEFVFDFGDFPTPNQILALVE